MPLNAAGRAQAARLAERLADVPIERVISSPLRRALETARILVRGARDRDGPAPRSKLDYGDWEGLTYEQVTARDGPARLAWEADPAGLACPGGESGNDVGARGLAPGAVLEAQIEAAPPSRTDAADHRVLVVGHSTTRPHPALRAPRRRRARLPAPLRAGPANLTVLRFVGHEGLGRQALVVNDIGHLEGDGATWD